MLSSPFSTPATSTARRRVMNAPDARRSRHTRRWLGAVAVVGIAIAGSVGVAGSASAAATGTIKGRIVSANGSGLAGIEVGVYQKHGDEYQFRGHATTDAHGRYVYDGVNAGSYTESISDPTNEYATEMLGNAMNIPDATKLTVGAGKTVTANSTLERGATLSGHITGNGGGALADVLVVVRATGSEDYPQSQIVQWVPTTDASGNFTIAGMASTKYSILYLPDPPYATQYRGHTPFVADSVLTRMRTGQETSYGEQLQFGAVVQGTITDGAAGIPEATVIAYGKDSTGEWQPVWSAETNGTGFYSMTPVPAVDLKLKVRADGYKTRWYSDAAKRKNGTVVHATPGNTTTGIDQVLIPKDS